MGPENISPTPSRPSQLKKGNVTFDSVVFHDFGPELSEINTTISFKLVTEFRTKLFFYCKLQSKEQMNV